MADWLEDDPTFQPGGELIVERSRWDEPRFGFSDQIATLLRTLPTSGRRKPLTGEDIVGMLVVGGHGPSGPQTCQSGTLPPPDGAELFAERIRHAYELQPPHKAVACVDRVWEEVEAVRSLAESRLRRLLKKVSLPEEAECPSWLSAELQCLTSPDEGLTPPAATTLMQARRLLQCLLWLRPGIERPVLALATHGSVRIHFSDEDITWLVSLAKLPWPGCDVRVYAGDAPKARVFHHASGVLSFTLSKMPQPA